MLFKKSKKENPEKTEDSVVSKPPEIVATVGYKAGGLIFPSFEEAKHQLQNCALTALAKEAFPSVITSEHRECIGFVLGILRKYSEIKEIMEKEYEIE